MSKVIDLQSYSDKKIKKLLLKDNQTEELRKKIRHLGKVKEHNKVG